MARDTTRRIRREGTVLDALRDSIRQTGKFAPGEIAPPAAILWTDEKAEWKALIPDLKQAMPELLELGEWDAERRRGPVIWLKCAIAGVLDDWKPPEGLPPVLYLPEIVRSQLKAADDCPENLRPLVELLYRGAVWMQVNGRDWTPEAFLVTENGGLGLELAKDTETRNALQQNLRAIASAMVAGWAGRRLQAEDFEKLVSGDPVRDLLAWMSEPDATRQRWDSAHWATFCTRCKRDYGFDPKADGELEAGKLLGLRTDLWKHVWARFEEAPYAWPGIPDLLRRAKPKNALALDDAWPQTNDAAEDSLQRSLTELAGKPAAEAREAVLSMEKTHGRRRQSVWAKLELSPMAAAMKHLADVATHTQNTLGGATPDAIAAAYTKGAYLADLAALRAYAAVKNGPQRDAVAAALDAIYRPWMQSCAEEFQAAVERTPLPGVAGKVEVEPGTVVLFADGLRYDVGQLLLEALNQRQLKATGKHGWAAVPTVTATAKLAASPVGASYAGNELGADFAPQFKDGAAATIDRFRKALADAGYQVLQGGDTGSPAEPDARAWTEAGELDSLGHKLGAALADRIEREVEDLCERITALMQAGWKRVQIVTDHGWLWLPSGLPKQDLPGYLTESKWSRCATIKGGSQVKVPTAPWSWNKTQQVAVPPGIACFKASKEYAHGGLSLQECLTPEIVVESSAAGMKVQADIEGVEWARLRCRVYVNASEKQVRVDLRRKAADPATTVAGGGKVTVDGKAGLVVENEDLIGEPVHLVVLDAGGSVITRRATTVGGEE